MLKLFFIITTWMALAKSEIAVEWVCQDTSQMGNCSAIPRISDLLQMISYKSDNNEYSDLYYCPFNIVERHSRCINSYFHSCLGQMGRAEQLFYLTSLSPIENSKTLCSKGRPYKKEFRQHVACMNEVLKVDELCEIPYAEWQQNQQQQLAVGERKIEEMQLKAEQTADLEIQFLEAQGLMQCQTVEEFLIKRYAYIRKHCGLKTEKFFRQVLGNMWPIPSMMRSCQVVL